MLGDLHTKYWNKNNYKTKQKKDIVMKSRRINKFKQRKFIHI